MKHPVHFHCFLFLILSFSENIVSMHPNNTLFEAIEQSHLENVKHALGSGASITTLDINNSTPLIRATHRLCKALREHQQTSDSMSRDVPLVIQEIIPPVTALTIIALSITYNSVHNGRLAAPDKKYLALGLLSWPLLMLPLIRSLTKVMGYVLSIPICKINSACFMQKVTNAQTVLSHILAQPDVRITVTHRDLKQQSAASLIHAQIGRCTNSTHKQMLQKMWERISTMIDSSQPTIEQSKTDLPQDQQPLAPCAPFTGTINRPSLTSQQIQKNSFTYPDLLFPY